MKRLPDWVERARAHWSWRGTARPSFAEPAGEGEESVWDYPRPPVLVADARVIRVELDGVVIAETRAAHRVLETSHPPTFYLPRADVDMSRLVEASAGSFCEWKGQAKYFDVARVSGAAWSYPDPIDARYEPIRGALAFYATKLACFVEGERVRPQSGGFYGGWITKELRGPFKGDTGSGGW